MSARSPRHAAQRRPRRILLAAVVLLACEREATTPPEPAPENAPVAAEVPVESGEMDEAVSPEAPTPEPASEPGPPSDPLATPNEARLATFHGGEEDAYLDFDKHYVKSNESRHDVWFPYIDELGGAYVGVGADQNYTLIARARSEWVFLLDIDPRVGQTHLAYRALIMKHESVEDFLANFERDAEARAVATIEETYADLDPAELKRIRRGFRAARETLRKHLGRVAKRSRDGAPSSWLSDPEAYQWIRRLYLADRVRIMPGDLTGATSMKTVGRVCGELSVDVGVLYLSNAEEYFKYFAGDYRSNVAALPTAEGSVVLRTLYGEDWEHADSLWNYQVQALADFAQRLSNPKLRSRNAMIRAARSEKAFDDATGVKGVTLVGAVSKRP